MQDYEEEQDGQPDELWELRRKVKRLEAEENRRRQVELILKERQRRLRHLVRYLTDYVYTVTIESGKVVGTYHGVGCVNVTGYTSRDYADNPELWFRMVHPDDREIVRENSQKAMRGEDVDPFEHRIIHRDGSNRWVRNTIVLNKDKNGELLAYDGLMNDITELKSAAEAADLHQRQLIQADKMTSLGILVSGIAHEVNNPNNFILLNTQFLNQVWQDILPILAEYHHNQGDFLLAGIPYSEAEKNIEQVLQGITKGSLRIKNIVNNLKKFSRPDAGGLDQLVDINHAVTSAIPIIENLIHKSTNKFELELGENLPAVRGNSQQLEQVIINLLTNACHALAEPSQGITLLTYFDEKFPNVVLEVRDQGKGIAPEHLNRIVDPFFTTKRDSDGTGLGLSISYQIIKNHQGILRFTSEVGAGTSAIIRLPVEPAAPDGGDLA